MFSYTGLTEKQSIAMCDEHHIYMVRARRPYAVLP